jgi:L-threonylcarbamoyladenylate synthase
VAQQLLNAFGGGIAAPSANKYGHVSPTRAEHVREEFGDELKFVLDGGDCKVGLESTIISCLADGPRVLRPGSISFSQLKAVVPTIQMGPNPNTPRVPGSTSRHYSPATPVNVVPSRRLETVMNEFTQNHEKVAVLAQRPPGTANPFMTWINAGIRPDIYARNLYANLRTLDKASAKIILVEEVPEGEKWDAVRDRLRRSASAENIVTYDQDIAAWVADFGEEGGPPG